MALFKSGSADAITGIASENDFLGKTHTPQSSEPQMYEIAAGGAVLWKERPS